MEKRNCKNCGKDFELEQKQIDYCNKMDYPLPKRCKSCLAKKRAEEYIKGKI